MSEDSKSAWGDSTQFFYQLEPVRILDAVETLDFRCTGRSLALNSMENRVYEAEIELEQTPKSPSERFKIIKFYRPGRWSRDQILEEHQFLADLAAAEIPVICPEKFPSGATVQKMKDADISYLFRTSIAVGDDWSMFLMAFNCKWTAITDPIV